MNKKAGFTLVEIMVALAVVAGIGLAITHVLKDYQMKTKTAKAKDELESTHQNILSILSSAQSCELTFAGKQFGQTIIVEEDYKNPYKERGIYKSKDNTTNPDSAKRNLQYDSDYFFNPEGSKIKLTKMVIGEVPPKQKFQEKGRLITVSFYYEVYKNELGGPPLILGDTTATKQHQFVFYNYIDKGFVSDKTQCPDGELTNEKNYSVELERPPYKKMITQYTCLDTNPQNPITKCVF